MQTVILSIEILAIYLLFREGMLLGWFRIVGANLFDMAFSKQWSRYLQKPLWDCYVCMSSFWTIILTLDFDVKQILLVCGLNFLITKAFDIDED